jgi:hypothetical protein
MDSTVLAQTRRKEMKGGQFSYESCIGAAAADNDLDGRGRGTEGVFVVHRSAA